METYMGMLFTQQRKINTINNGKMEYSMVYQSNIAKMEGEDSNSSFKGNSVGNRDSIKMENQNFLRI